MSRRDTARLWIAAHAPRRRRPDGTVSEVNDYDVGEEALADLIQAGEGIRTLQYVVRARERVLRMSEVVQIEEPSNARRTVTLYTRAPDLHGNEPEDHPDAVPLLLFQKRRLNLFHVTDERDRLAPTLTSSLRRELLVNGLEETAREVLNGDEDPTLVRLKLERIVSRDAATASMALEDWEQAAEQQVESIEARLWGDPDYQSLLRLLAVKTPVMVPLTAGGPPFRVVRFTWEENIQRDPLSWRQPLLLAKRFWLGSAKAVAWRATKNRPVGPRGRPEPQLPLRDLGAEGSSTGPPQTARSRRPGRLFDAR